KALRRKEFDPNAFTLGDALSPKEKHNINWLLLAHCEAFSTVSPKSLGRVTNHVHHINLKENFTPVRRSAYRTTQFDKDNISASDSRRILFCSLDVKDAFLQLPLSAESQKLSTFTCWKGAFAYRVTPFGLTGIPSSLAKFTNKTFHDFIGKICFIYFDDFIVLAFSLKLLHSRLHAILVRLKFVNLTFTPD